MPKAHDPINHPRHYTSHPSGVECIQITEHMNFCLGNAIKYIWRVGLKIDASKAFDIEEGHEMELAQTIEDLEKAKWYLEREIERRRKTGEARS